MSHILSRVGVKKVAVLLVALLLCAGFISFFSNAGDVGAVGQPEVSACTVGGIGNGGACFSGSQCVSGFCAGGDGLTCGSGSCQDAGTPGDTGGPPSMTDDDVPPGGDPPGGGGDDPPGDDPPCPQFTPQPPESVSGNFSSLDIINVTIPAAPNNGSGDSHQIKIVLASQDLNQVSNPLAIESGISLSASAIQRTYSIDSFGQSVKIGVRNYDSCQGIYGPWEAQIVSLPTYLCTGTPANNSTMCVGDDTNLLQDTPWSLTSSCSAAIKCERECSAGFTKSGDQCVPIINETGNVYGYAWSSNVGWIKMNRCLDVSPFDGLPDASSCESAQYGVRVNNANNAGSPPAIPAGAGPLTGHAWNDKIGWIRFGGWSGFPNTAEAPGTVAANAELLNVNSLSGTFQGWARALTGGSTPGFDGWLSLSGQNYYSGPIAGNAGVTYHVPTARLMGWAWGGNVLGWVSFSGDNSSAFGPYQVTYGAPSNVFNYDLTRIPTGTITVDQGSTEDVTIIKTLTSGAPQAVSLTTSVSGVPNPKPTATITTNQNCAPTCESNLAITAGPTVPFGSYSVRVVGQPLNKILNIPVEVVAAGATPLSVVCEVESNPPHFVNNPLSWKATVTGGVAPYSFTWSGSDGFTCAPGAACQSVNGAVSISQKTYSTTGVKNANVSVTDSAGSLPGTCSPPAQATVVVQPNIIEF